MANKKRNQKSLDQILEQRKNEWVNKGVKPENITYGMVSEGYRSTPGVPDDFLSEEDHDVRARLYKERVLDQQGRGCGSDCGCCSSCDPTYRD